MQVHQYLAVGFRLLAIVVFIYGLRQLIQFFAVVFTDSFAGLPASPPFFLAMAAIPLIVSAILWLFPTVLAKKVVPPSSDAAVIPEKSYSIFVALILTIGVYFLFYASVDLVYWITYAYLLSTTPESYDRTSDILQSNRANTTATVFEFAVALLIILRAKFLANFIYNAAK